jgi:hypothetical protein
MRDPEKIRAIYAELRKAVGGEASPGVLLRLAYIILSTYNSDLDHFDEFGRPVESRTFFALPVDEAMRDGGWRILNFESRRSFGLDDVDPQDLVTLKVLIQRFLGPTWQQ